MTMEAVSALDELSEDHSREPVPLKESVHGIRIATIIIGVMITVPVLVTGSEIGLAMGLENAIATFFIGGFVLTLLCCLTAAVGAKARISTYMLLGFSFGSRGAKIVNCTFVASLLGWAAVTVALFGRICTEIVSKTWGIQVTAEIWMVVGSVIMVFSIVFGFSALDRINKFSVPILIMLLGYLVWISLDGTSFDILSKKPGTGLRFELGLSIVIGGFIVGTALMPDIARYLPNTRHGVLASVLSVSIGYPLILTVATIVTVATGQKDLVLMLSALGLGVSAMILLGLASWTSNAINYYASGLALAAVFSRVKKWKLTLLAGLASALIAVLGISEHLIGFLLFLGFTIPPICGIYIVDFFILKKQKYELNQISQQKNVNYNAFAAWMLGTLIGYLSAFHPVITITTIPALDSLCVAMCSIFIFTKLSELFQSRSVEVL